jgi:hypothetical protein
MLVKELIQELQKFNPEEELVFHCDIESGRSFSICKDGDLSVSLEDLDEDEIKELWMNESCWDDEEDMEEDEREDMLEWVKNYTPRVVVSISGEETNYE